VVVADISYTLLIDGAAAGADIMAAIQQIEVEDSADMASMLRLRLGIGVKDDSSGWTVIDDSLFSRLTNITLKLAVGSGSAEALIDAYVMETNTTFSGAPGLSLMEVVAMDASVLMTLEDKARSFPNMSDSDIANQIFGEYGFTAQVDSTQPARQEDDVVTMQHGSDIAFLRTLAYRNGFECYVEMDPEQETNMGYFRAPQLEDDPQGVLAVSMGDQSNVNTLNVRYQMLLARQAKINNVSLDDESTQTGDAQTASQNQLGKDGVLSDDRPRKSLPAAIALVDSGELQTFAQAIVDRSSWAVVAEGDLNTTAYGGLLRAKRPVLLQGAGSTHSGTYYVERVLHTITSNSYTQRFTLSRNALGLTGEENFTPDGGLS
jgi:phage protein D